MEINVDRNGDEGWSELPRKEKKIAHPVYLTPSEWGALSNHGRALGGHKATALVALLVRRWLQMQAAKHVKK